MRRRRNFSPGKFIAFALLGAGGLVLSAVIAIVRTPNAPPATSSAPPPAASDPFPNEWPAPPPPEVAALLDGLGPNTPLVGRWTVRGISPVQNARVTLDVDRGDVGLRVWIVRRESDPRRPPAQTER